MTPSYRADLELPYPNEQMRIVQKQNQVSLLGRHSQIGHDAGLPADPLRMFPDLVRPRPPRRPPPTGPGLENRTDFYPVDAQNP